MIFIFINVCIFASLYLSIAISYSVCISLVGSVSLENLKYRNTKNV